MNSAAARRLFLALLLILLALPSAAQFNRRFFGCPLWDGGYTTAGTATTAQWLRDFGGCQPFVVSCPAPYDNPTYYNCTVTYGTGPLCPAPGYTHQPQYWDIWGGPGVYFDNIGQYHCGAQGNDPKNLGCNDCDKWKQLIGFPVNIGTGNKVLREVDFPRAAGGLEFTRTYNSAAGGSASAIGVNWSHTWARSATKVTSTDMRVTRADGKVLWFTLSGGLWVGDADNPETLTVISGGGYQLITRDDEVETYDAQGKLLSVATREGLVTTLSYSDGTTSPPNGQAQEGTTTAPVAAGTLLRVTDPFGRTLRFGYNIWGYLVRMTDPTGGVYRYTTDSYVMLTSVQYPDLTTRSYLYNESANTSGAFLPHALTGITDENGKRFATYKYLSDGRAYHSEHAGGVDNYDFTYGTGTATYTSPLGTSYQATISTILGMQQLSSTTQTCTGCGGSSTETLTFDANRNLTSRKDYNGNLTCYSFDTTRNLETARTEGLSGTGTCASPVTTTATRTITTEWRSTLRMPKRVAEPLKITTFSFNGDPGVSCAPTGASTALICSKTVQATTDADGSQGFSATSDGAARVWAHTYNALAQVLTVDGPRTDANEVTTNAYYASDDPSGNYKAGDLASVTNALSQTTQFTQYDGAGRLKKMIDPNGLETILDYWPRGWLKSRKVGTAAAGYETTSYDYDNAGQLTKVTLPDASYVSYTFDDAHRLTTIQDGLGNKMVYTLDNAGNRTAENAYDISVTLVRTHTRVIDALNRLKQDIGGTNPTTQITQNTYDGNGNLTTVTDPLSRVTTQVFDARDRLTEIRDPFNGSSAPTKFEYNGQDQLTKVTDPANLATTYSINGHGELLTQVSPDTGTTVFTYDPASNLKTKLDARAIQAAYSYDAINRVTQIVYPDETVLYTYDTCTNGVGRLCSIVDNSGTTSYAFDVKGRITSKTQVVSGITRTMGYAYNAAGQLVTVTTPSGKQVVYTYSNNRPISVTVDDVKVLDTVVYEPFGPNGGWQWGNSTGPNPNTHTRVFDKDFRPTRITSDLPTNGSQPYFDRQIGWDDQSRVASMTDLANSALNASYGFDALDRLTSATQGTSSWSYTYSGVGDRLTSSANSATTNYGYISGSHKLQTLSGAQSKSYTLDAAGNMTSDGTTTWTYAGNNRATQAGSTTFLINALGQRVKKAGPSTTLFVFDESGQLWGEYDGTGALISETIWLDDLPVATYNTGLNYVHPDYLGTSRLVTRPSDNAIVWRWDNTEPFGNSQPNSNPSGLGSFTYNLRFPGQYFDAETGKHYNYFRDYDPSIGRYIESDPIGLRGGINTYGYVSARPLTLVDWLGLKSRVCCRGIPATGNIAGHCYLETQNGTRTTFGLFGGPGTGMAPGVGQTFIDRSFDAGGSCGDWNEDCGTDDCVKNAAGNYPNPSSYDLGGPNSNTFASNVASKCKLKGPTHPYWTPGWGNAPAPQAPGYGPVPINTPPLPPLPGGPQNPFSSGGG